MLHIFHVMKPHHTWEKPVVICILFIYFFNFFKHCICWFFGIQFKAPTIKFLSKYQTIGKSLACTSHRSKCSNKRNFQISLCVIRYIFLYKQMKSLVQTIKSFISLRNKQSFVACKTFFFRNRSTTWINRSINWKFTCFIDR